MDNQHDDDVQTETAAVGVRLRDFFDADYYVERYPDVRGNELRPLAHFREVGLKEGRVPTQELEALGPALARRAGDSPAPLLDFLGLMPRGTRKQVLNAPFWGTFRQMVHPDFYAAQVGAPSVKSVDATLEDFLAEGVFEGMRPGLLFHPEWYARVVEEESGKPIPEDCHPFIHWMAVGRHKQWIPTPLFDADYYQARHPDLRRIKTWVFHHYFNHGAFERGRRPSTFVQPAATDHPEAKDLRRPYLTDQVLAGSTTEQLRTSSPLEDRAMLAIDKLTHLDRPVMRDMVEKAYEIEPMIRRPYGPREVNWPPLLNSAVALRDRVEQARARIGTSHVDNLIFVPHCRMAGSARVTGALVTALTELAPEESVLVVTTDLPTFERPDWFPPGIQVVDTSELGIGLLEEYQTRLLLDVVRGLQPRRVVNVNSRRCWDLYRLFGQQLQTMTQLHAYLFTWDIDPEGNKGGYPINYLQQCLGSLDRVLIDNSRLRDELVWRYAHSKQMRDQLRVVHTPALYPPHTDHSPVFAQRRAEGRKLRTFWSGRFDRQKRFDVVVELARLMPELEIWVWGKTVLGGAQVDFEDLPDNIRLQGTYQDFEDLPVESCDFFLYTSQWDGLPTILIDAGARGVATVGSLVGGVSDVLDDTCGYPVADALDPRAYADEIRRMVADPEEVTRRAAGFRSRVREMCASDRYAADIASALRLVDPGQADPAASHPASTEEPR